MKRRKIIEIERKKEITQQRKIQTSTTFIIFSEINQYGHFYLFIYLLSHERVEWNLSFFLGKIIEIFV